MGNCGAAARENDVGHMDQLSVTSVFVASPALPRQPPSFSPIFFSQVPTLSKVHSIAPALNHEHDQPDAIRMLEQLFEQRTMRPGAVLYRHGEAIGRHAGLWIVRTGALTVTVTVGGATGIVATATAEAGACFLEKRPPDRYLETVRASDKGSELFFLPLPTWRSFCATFPGLSNRIQLHLASDIAQQLSVTPLFRHLRENKAHCKIDMLAQLFARSLYVSGECIVQQGADAPSFFVLCSGRAQLSMYGRDTLAAEQLEPGAWFGEMGCCCVATVTAKTDCSVFVLRHSDFDLFRHLAPELAAELDRLTDQRVRQVLAQQLPRPPSSHETIIVWVMLQANQDLFEAIRLTSTYIFPSRLVLFQGALAPRRRSGGGRAYTASQALVEIDTNDARNLTAEVSSVVLAIS